jgi:two-component system chemotaxis sensor kinase CheA
VLANVMPIEASIDLLPKRLSADGRVCKLGYTPILAAGEVERCFVVVTDITADVARENLEAEQRDVLALFDRIVRNKRTVVEFLTETARQLQHIQESPADVSALKRDVHTIKGNAGMLGLAMLASACERLENCIESEGAPSPQLLEQLTESFQGVRARAETFLGSGLDSRIEVDAAELEEVLDACAAGVSTALIAKRLRSWKLEPIARRFERVVEQIERLAKQLGKPIPEVHMLDRGIRLESEEWASFWSAFVHVVRNTIDHGIEDRATRERVGKPAQGRVDLSARFERDSLVIEVTDDGAGVDWETVADKARARGLPSETRADLREAIFTNGISTAAVVSEISGRGVGMSVLREECVARSGTIDIESERGSWTCVKLVFPTKVGMTRSSGDQSSSHAA